MDYLEFRKQYLEQHPASVPIKKAAISPYPSWARPGSFAMFLTASLLSGVHTIPLVYVGIPNTSVISDEVRRLAAHGSFIAFELSVFMSAFLLLVKSSMRWAYLMLGVAFFAMMVANIKSISDALGNGQDIGDILVSIAFGIGVPLIALVAGKLYVNIHTAERRLEIEVEEEYEETLRELDRKILSAWKSYLKQEKAALPDVSVVNLRKFTTERPSKKLQSALDWLKEHPGQLDTESRELANVIGVSHMTVYKAQQLMKNGYINGKDTGSAVQ